MCSVQYLCIAKIFLTFFLLLPLSSGWFWFIARYRRTEIRIRPKLTFSTHRNNKFSSNRFDHVVYTYSWNLKIIRVKTGVDILTKNLVFFSLTKNNLFVLFHYFSNKIGTYHKLKQNYSVIKEVTFPVAAGWGHVIEANLSRTTF